MHVDSWAASGAASNDYFSVRAIEQQHGVITNIFFVYSLLRKLNLFHVNSFYSFSHTRVHKECVCVCIHKQVNTKRKKEEAKAETVDELRICHVYFIRGQIKKEILFSTSKASRWGIPLFLSYSDSPPPLLPVS